MRKMRRTSLIKRGPLPLRYVFLITFVFFIFLTVFSMIIINNNLEPNLQSIAHTKARQVASEAINDAISKKITDGIDMDQLIVVKEYSDGQLTFSFNSQISNRVISEATMRVQRYLELVEEGNLEDLESFKNDININYEESKKQHGIVYDVPLGMATGATLFSNLGPKIPVKLEIMGDVISDVETRVIETGINNTHLELFVRVNVKMNVIIPLIEPPIEISNVVKIGDIFVTGKVPQYYHHGGGNSNGSSNGGMVPIFVPTEEEDAEGLEDTENTEETEESEDTNE